MTPRSVVAVYGLRQGSNVPRKLGEGALVHPELVVVEEDLRERLASDQPPSVLRVGVASMDGDLRVEVIEVTRTIRSTPTDAGRLFGLELAEPARASLVPYDTEPLFRSGGRPAEDGASERGDGQVSQAAATRLWCLLFPSASFCR